MDGKAIRGIAKNGNSYTVAIPRQFLAAMFLLKGDEVLILYDDQRKTLTIKRAFPRERGVTVSLRGHRGVRPLLS
jgi:antitoxin component of MazEF toxin-antitoxin module